MTSMQQIELISVEARKRGMTYGEYVEKFPPQFGAPEPISKKEARVADIRKAEKVRERNRINEQMRRKGLIGKASDEPEARMRHFRNVECVCKDCGNTFTAKRRDAKYCPDCTMVRRCESVKRCQKRARGLRSYEL